MQSILRWAIENSDPQPSETPSQGEQRTLKDLDPGIIDMILGKPDSEQMKEDMAVATDPSKSEDDRINALDHLEMLIESIDNANADLEKLKLWEPLHSILTHESSTQDIKTQGLWVVGTAVQNNPSAQDAYLSHNPLPTLVDFLNPSASNSAATRAKAIYTLSGLLRHNAPALQLLNRPEVDGWTKLRNALQGMLDHILRILGATTDSRHPDPSIAVRRKAIFLLSALLMPSGETHTPPSSAPPDALRITNTDNTTSSSTEERPTTTSTLSTSVPTTTQPTATTTATGANILTPDHRPAPADGAPIHANSHSAHLKDPTRSNTSSLTLAALQEHGILDAVISGITVPVPHGEDGEHTDADDDFEEKGMHLLYTYAVVLQGDLSQTQKETLRKWAEGEKAKLGEAKLLEKWNFSKEEYDALIGKLA
ncbi:hypothetical protein CVT26_011970 [Gymnopilus dilepis]|uniref:Nucleotide exchange factor Fes1 domain-containing protein n=1 Tax=Gymnopilus dilepis TaxID=231916 RepID=A0A409VYJ6_9AGAR|nr:hypothetical protein CVT26_011970 [Gymnopilus dilepis]